MIPEITTIKLMLPLNIGSVNCFLVKTETGFILIDTGITKKRAEVERALENAGCKPGNLKLIILTHGDFDHCGNAEYFGKKYNTQIAMHVDDSRMAELGDMFFNRKTPNIVMKMLAKTMYGLDKSDRFKPDLYIHDGFNFSEYGLDAQTINIPGHSKGSIGILTGNGDLICGDLFENTKKPSFGVLIDKPAEAKASMQKLKNFTIKTVYPGHGNKFQWQELMIP